jgi:UPF0755 protein
MLTRILKTAFALAAIAAFILFIWLSFELHFPRKIAADQVIFEVPKGMGVSGVAEMLGEQGFIRSPLSFVVGYRLFFYPQKIKAGEYALASPVKAKEILDLLVRGKVLLHNVTIPEGLTALEIEPLVSPLLSDGEEGFAAAFRKAGSIAALDPQAENLEGYLYPETYSFPRGIDAEEVLKAMVDEFKAVFEEAWRARTSTPRMSPRQVVILASLIEKETSVPEEKRLVSAVFHNRLRVGMKLDCDPTIIYALKMRGTWQGRLRKKDLALDSLYNTYLYPGLPPGPICNPGREALEAALYPAEEGFLYFVSKNDGSHHFSRTFSEHQNAVRRFQKSGK